MKNTQINIRDIDKWDEDYYPKKEKFKKKKPRKKDLDGTEKGIIIRKTNNKQ